MDDLHVGLFNDSFPPMIDGVANTVLNYAKSIDQHYGMAVVATPWYPKVEDNYPFTVLRYPSAYISKRLGYRAGFPFDPYVVNRLQKQKLHILHSHCPFISTILARELRFRTGAPIVFTYHTKFDIDIQKRIALNPVRSASIKFLLSNINACDEVWVVSKGAGENLRGLGYNGEYRLMENGTDFPKGRASQDQIDRLAAQYHIQPDETVFLFVGRMMWYKNLRCTIDGLKQTAAQGKKFRMFLVGDGLDRSEIEQYIIDNGLSDRCIFTGAIRDRELLRVYFSLADLFLFPSVYDTNGIVVKEAAACSCPSLVVRGSCAAEGIVDGETGIFIEENADSMAQAICDACENRQVMRTIGQNAAEKVYLSWDDAVGRAVQRYGEILDNHARKMEEPSRNDVFFDNVQRICDDLEVKAEEVMDKVKSRIYDIFGDD